MKKFLAALLCALTLWESAALAAGIPFREEVSLGMTREQVLAAERGLGVIPEAAEDGDDADPLDSEVVLAAGSVLPGAGDTDLLYRFKENILEEALLICNGKEATFFVYVDLYRQLTEKYGKAFVLESIRPLFRNHLLDPRIYREISYAPRGSEYTAWLIDEGEYAVQIALSFLVSGWMEETALLLHCVRITREEYEALIQTRDQMRAFY